MEWLRSAALSAPTPSGEMLCGNDRKKSNCKYPTQAKTGLEWATRPPSRECLPIWQTKTKKARRSGPFDGIAGIALTAFSERL
jgi:hypothetical protein